MNYGIMEKIFCRKLKKKCIRMKENPLPGKLGERIRNEISQEGWIEWINYQTILINEYRLNLLNKKSREFLIEEMEKFFFEST